MEITKETLRTAVAQATESMATTPGIKPETAMIVDVVGMGIGQRLEEYFFGKEKKDGIDMG